MSSDRTGPSELLVPVALAAVVELSSQLVPAAQGGAPLSLATVVSRDILVLCGLLAVRRGIAGWRSQLLLVGALLQGVAAVMHVGASLVAPFLDRADQMTYWTTVSYLSSSVAMSFTLTMLAASGGWRSWLAPFAIIATLAWRMPMVLARSVGEVLAEYSLRRAYFPVAALLAQLALFAIFRRMIVAEPGPADLARAERGARRAAWALRVRGLALGLRLLLIGVLAALDAGDWVMQMSAVLGVATVAAVGLQVSGLLAMARASVPGMSPAQLRVATFGALWVGLLVAVVRFFGIAARVDVVLIIGAIVDTVCVVVGANAMRTLATQRGDAALDAAITNRVTVVVALQITSIVALLVEDARTMIGGVMMVGYTVLQLAALIVLAGMYARVARRMRVAVATDAF